MRKTIWVVQWNLGGFTGPFKAKWYGELEAYFSGCGDFEYDPKDFIKDGIWQVSFDNERDAKKFAEGCRFTMKWIAHRFNNDLSESDET